MVGQPHLAPSSGVLSPRWGLVASPFAFQGLAPLATNLGSSGAGTRRTHSHRNARAHSHRNAHAHNHHNTHARCATGGSSASVATGSLGTGRQAASGTPASLNDISMPPSVGLAGSPGEQCSLTRVPLLLSSGYSQGSFGTAQEQWHTCGMVLWRPTSLFPVRRDRSAEMPNDTSRPNPHCFGWPTPSRAKYKSRRDDSR